MSINNIEEQDLADESTVKQPYLNANPDSPVVEVNVDPSTNPKEVMQKDIDLLANAKIKLSYVDDGYSTLVDMQEVEDQIATESAICQSSFSLLSTTFGDSVTKGLTKNHFSATPTKTNLLYVQNKMRSSIAAENAKVGSLLSEFYNTLAQDVLTAIQRCREHYLPFAGSIVKKNIEEFPELIGNSKHGCYVNHNGKVVNMFSMDLVNNKDEQLPDDSVFSSVLDMGHVTSWKHVQLLCYCMHKNVSLIEALSTKSEAPMYMPTLKDVVELCVSDKGLKFFEDVYNLTQNLEKSVMDRPTINVEDIKDSGLVKFDEYLHWAKEFIASVYYFSHIAQRLSTFLPALDAKCK